MALLEIRDLSVTFDTDDGLVEVIDRISLDVEAGTTHGIVGESGCGKSVTALAIMGLLPKPSGKVSGGKIIFDGKDLTGIQLMELHSVRGRRISMIFQEPMTALNPVQRIGHQLVEIHKLHKPNESSEKRFSDCVDLLDQVGIPDPRQRMSEYPHQLSGGMRQRAMIAMALVHVPDILIADEPTTALDVTIQAQILELISELQQSFGMAVIFITHDLAVIAEMADQVTVMYAGRIFENTDATSLFNEPFHPYTIGLLNSIPKLDGEPKTQLPTIRGMVPSFSEMPSGCRFRNRCDYASERCSAQVPQLEPANISHHVACHYWRDIVSQRS